MARAALYPAPITLDNVYFLLRNRAYFSGMNDGWFSDDLVKDGPGDLMILVYSDLGEGLKNVTTAAAEKAGFTPTEVLAAAEENVLNFLPNLHTWPSEMGVLSAGFEDHDWLGSSLLLLPKALEIVMQGAGWDRALVSSMSRETVDFVNADDPYAVAAIEDWMHQLGKSDPRPQSEFVWTMHIGDAVPVKTHKMYDGQLIALS